MANSSGFFSGVAGALAGGEAFKGWLAGGVGLGGVTVTSGALSEFDEAVGVAAPLSLIHI